MEITLIGYILIPIGLILAVVAPIRVLLYMLIFFSSFTATAIININSPSFGLQPGYYFGLLFMLRFGVEFLLKGVDSCHRVQAVVLGPLWYFCIVAFLSIIVIPFYGPVYVHRPSGETVLLKLSGENFTQFVYLVYVIALTTSIALCKPTPEEMNKCLKVFIFSGLFVVFWGWMQVVMFYLKIPYPEYLFNNSVSFSQNYEQFMAAIGLKRMNSVAPEPSMMARFLLIPTFMSFYCAYNRNFLFKYRHCIILTPLFSITLISTTSATAAAGFLGGLFIFYFFVTIIIPKASTKGRGALGADRTMKPLVIVLLLLFVAGSILFSIAVWRLGFSVDRLVTFTNLVLLDKLETQSGQGRLDAALSGLELFVSHPVLGIGWGSNRTFDITTNMLSATGCIGAVLFACVHLILAWYAIRLIRSGLRYTHPLIPSYVEILLLALGVRVFGKMLSEPGTTFIDHWILVGLTVASLGWVKWVPSRSEGEQQESHLLAS